MPFLVFGESQTSGVVYVSNNNFQATYDMMKAVTEENLKYVVAYGGRIPC